MPFYKFPFEKYKFIFCKTHSKNGAEANKIIATSTYAGKVCRGVAICAPEDQYDEETGKKLAAARCNLKVAQKRYKNSSGRLDEANECIRVLEEYREQMANYNIDAYQALKQAETELKDLEARLATT